MSDVARVELGTENYAMSSHINGANASSIAVYQIPGSNAWLLPKKCERKMTELQERFPPDMTLNYSLDTTLAVTCGY